MDCSFQSPAPFREQRAYKEEYPVSWNPHFARMARDLNLMSFKLLQHIRVV